MTARLAPLRPRRGPYVAWRPAPLLRVLLLALALLISWALFGGLIWAVLA